MRAWSLILLCGCGPATAVLVGDGDGGGEPGTPDPGECDASFDAVQAWSAVTEDYGMIRGATGFSGDGSEFFHAAGTYQSTARSFDAATGAVLSESTGDGWLVGRDDDVDLVTRQRPDGASSDVDVIDRASGRVVGTIPSVDPPWTSPAVALRGDTIAVARCVSRGVLELTTYDRRGEPRSDAAMLGACATWNPRLVDVSPSTGKAVVYPGNESHHALLVDLATGDAVDLADHGDPNPDQWLGYGYVLDVGFSPDGDVVATAGADGVLLLHDGRTGERLGERPILVTPVNRYIYASPDTRSPFAFSAAFLARATPDGSTVVERRCDGEVVATLPFDAALHGQYDPDPGRPAVLRFSPDEDALFAVYEGGVQALRMP